MRTENTSRSFRRLLAFASSILFLAVFRLDGGPMYQEKPEVRNINLDLQENIATITYDLIARLDGTFDVAAFLTKEGDPTYRIPIKSATGDIGRGKFAGLGRKIQWEWKKDLPKDFAGGAVAVEFEVTMVGADRSPSERWVLFSQPDFRETRFGVDVVYYGANYVENLYSRSYFSPSVLSLSYAVIPNVAAQVSFTSLKGDYKLRVVQDSKITALLKNRPRLWGNGINSYGLGAGVVGRYWRMRVGGQFVTFFDLGTDLSPTSAILVTADCYIVQRVYVGLSMMMLSQTGLIDPVHVGATIPSDDQGITRKGFGSPSVLTLHLGVDLF